MVHFTINDRDLMMIYWDLSLTIVIYPVAILIWIMMTNEWMAWKDLGVPCFQRNLCEFSKGKNVP